MQIKYLVIVGKNDLKLRIPFHFQTIYFEFSALFTNILLLFFRYFYIRNTFLTYVLSFYFLVGPSVAASAPVPSTAVTSMAGTFA